MTKQQREIIAMYQIIGIDKCHVFTLCYVECCITRRGRACILLMKNGNSCITARIIVANATTAIGRAIIYEQQLEVSIRLC